MLTPTYSLIHSLMLSCPAKVLLNSSRFCSGVVREGMYKPRFRSTLYTDLSLQYRQPTLSVSVCPTVCDFDSELRNRFRCFPAFCILFMYVSVSLSLSLSFGLRLTGLFPHRVVQCSVAEWLGSRTCDQQFAGSNPGRRAAECNPGKVVYTHVSLSPSSISWYQRAVMLVGCGG